MTYTTTQPLSICCKIRKKSFYYPLTTIPIRDKLISSPVDGANYKEAWYYDRKHDSK